jgi:DNA-binding Lrp family transcriptional regulator
VERARITAARQHVEKLQRGLTAAELERDLAILDAYNARAQVTEIAAAAGISRNSVYAAVKRAESAPD